MYIDAPIFIYYIAIHLQYAYGLLYYVYWTLMIYHVSVPFLQFICSSMWNFQNSCYGSHIIADATGMLSSRSMYIYLFMKFNVVFVAPGGIRVSM